MSGELNREAPTSVQNSTQGRNTSPFNFNVSINVILDPATQEALERIATALESTGAIIPEVPESMEEKSSLADPVDNGEFRATIVPRPDWIQIPRANNKRALYRESEGKLIIKYQSCTELETSWREIEKYSKMEEAEYKAACEKRFQNKSQKQQNTGLNHMVRAFRDGQFPGRGMCSLKDLFGEEAAAIEDGEVPEKKVVKKHKGSARKEVPGFKNLTYLEQEGQLHIWYSGTILKTTWTQVEEVSRKGLKYSGRLLAEIVGEKASNNKYTAIRQFVRAFDAGAIQRSTGPEEELEKNFSMFQAEEDGDAAFRPMMSSYSTRPDENCGKVEGVGM